MVDIWRKCYMYWLFLYKYILHKDVFEVFWLFTLVKYQSTLLFTRLSGDSVPDRTAGVDENLDDDLI